VIVTLASVAIGISADFTLGRFVQAVLAPLLPLIIFCTKQWTENMSAAKSADDLRAHAEEVWKKGLSGAPDEELEKESQDLQCEIFSHRKSAPLVFDWVYYRLRSDQEENDERWSGSSCHRSSGCRQGNSSEKLVSLLLSSQKQ